MIRIKPGRSSVSFYLQWRMETASPELIPNRAAIFLPPTEDENKKE